MIEVFAMRRQLVFLYVRKHTDMSSAHSIKVSARFELAHNSFADCPLNHLSTIPELLWVRINCIVITSFSGNFPIQKFFLYSTWGVVYSV